jgi:hydrogenase maturation protease
LSEQQHEPSRRTEARIIILALGNPLRGDDGVGQAVVECLQRAGLPPGVAVLDGGTAGLETVLLLQGYDRALIVDAAEMNRPPGKWERFTTAGVELQADDLHARVTVHYAGLAEALELGKALGILPAEIVIYGVQPQAVGWTPGLSKPVQAAVPAVCAAILNELQATA